MEWGSTGVPQDTCDYEPPKYPRTGTNHDPVEPYRYERTML